MTASVFHRAEARLAALAAWDVPQVRGAVVTLGAIAERLPAWRVRLAEVARVLESAESWSGPAARSAVHAVFDLSTVATVLDTALSVSQESFERLAGEADAAQERAVEALALARSLEGGLSRPLAEHTELYATSSALVPGVAPPDSGPAVAAAEAALAHADAVAAAADAAGTALAGLGVRDAFAPADFTDLASRIQVMGPVAPPPVPSGEDPAQVAVWWSNLSAGARLAVLRARPAAVGSLDGVPAWARDRANRLLLDRARRHGRTPRATGAARAVAERIAIEEAAGRPLQLHALDLEAEEVVLVLGDLDTADAVGVLVPGINNSPDDLPRLVGDAGDVAEVARAAGPGLEIATVVWLGYASPQLPKDRPSRSVAVKGGQKLAAALEGMAAARVAARLPQARTSVLAHSFGTVVVDEAADVPGRLAADAVVLLGSPGMEPEGAESLEAPDVYDAWSAADPVSYGVLLGSPTWVDWYGSTGLPNSHLMTHSDYYDGDFPTLGAIGAVVAGARVPD